jgi:hypothetical protein
MKKQLFILICASAFKLAIAQNYQVSTIAGSGTLGYIDSTASACELYWPYGSASDNDSAIYFSDAGNHSIRKLNIYTNKVTTIAGNGIQGLQDGIGSAAQFNWPDDVFFKNGFLYIGDNMNNCIRKIDLSTNMVTTIAGTGVSGYLDGPANSAMFQGGNGIAIVVANNNDIYVADGSNAVIRKISGGQVTTVAGTPGVFGYVDGLASSAKFHRPRYLALDTANTTLYITDINNNVIRKLYNNQVSTFAGTGIAGGLDGGPDTATFSAPVGIALTFNNFLYVVDGGGNKLRKVDQQGNVITIAGNGTFGFQDGAAASAEFYYPQGVTYDEHGIIYMADRNNNRIRRIQLPDAEAKIHSVTSIKNYVSKNTDVSMYPNPCQGILNIQTINAESSIYKLYDALGQELKTGTISQGLNQLNIQDLANGVYSLSILQKGKTTTSKLILQKQ